jgi:hypothetical protein
MQVRRFTALMAAGVMATMVAGTIGSVGPAEAAIIGTGTVTCSGASGGEVSFSPPWTDTGTGTVTARVSFNVSECGETSPRPVSVEVTGTLKFANGRGRCSADGVETSGRLKLAWAASPAVKNSHATGRFSVAPEGFGSVNHLIVRGSYATRSGAQVGGGTYPNGNCTSGVTSLTDDYFNVFSA